jgi:site-specific DNA recombinase
MRRTDGTLTPAGSYIRMSGKQQEASPEQQWAEIRKMADRLGYKILREYFDEGISGDATQRRKAFQQMIRGTEEKRDYAAILCWDQDRFGRFDSIAGI